MVRSPRSQPLVRSGTGDICRYSHAPGIWGGTYWQPHILEHVGISWRLAVMHAA